MTIGRVPAAHKHINGCKCRLNASHKAAERYVAQFPSPLLSSVAKFVAFIAGSFAALLLFLTLMNDDLLERHLYGRNLVWCASRQFLHPEQN